MKRSKVKQPGAETHPEPPTPDGAERVSGADFLLSMVETHWSPSNNGSGKASAASKAEQELAHIERQLEQLHSVAGQTEEVRNQIQQLHDRVDTLRRQMHSNLGAWEKAELARHPQRPYTLDYVERIFA